jgi:phosphodiesterase/alkaline phosphatase D-like protein
MRSYPSLRTACVAVLTCALLAALPASAGAAKHFKLGVASAEVSTSAAILWTRADSVGKFKLLLATNKELTGARQIDVTAKKFNDRTVHKRVRGLTPGKLYFYRFKQNGHRSALGHFVTAPKENVDRTIRFAVSGDADATRKAGETNVFYDNLPGNNGLGAEDFGVYAQMTGEKNAFNVNLGDTIYSDSEVAGKGTLAKTVEQKWAHYRLNLLEAKLQRMRASTSTYNHWDDHEFRNDFSRPEFGDTIYKAGAKAFLNYMPAQFTFKRGLYNHHRWGKNLEMFRLDERSFRSAKASANHTCDNPETHQPDLAPTAPQETRDKFAALVPSLKKPVPQACTKAINDPKRTFLGDAQREAFIRDVKASTARFKVVLTELPIQQFYALPYDRWEGYEAERKKVLHALENSGVKNLVWIATDVHANLVNVVRYKTLENGGPQDSRYSEFVTGPVSTMTFRREIDQATGKEGNGNIVDAGFFSPPPPNGVGMSCSNVDIYSYAEVSVNSKRVAIAAKDVRGNVVKDQSAGTPCKLTIPLQ